jgi:hypothetical protein
VIVFEEPKRMQSDGMGGLQPEALPSIVPADVLAAAAVDAEAPASPVAAAAQSTVAPIDYATEAREIIEFAHAMFTPLWPSLGTVYTDDVRARIIATAAPLMEKYKFTLGVIGPELAFVLVTAPLVYPTIAAVKHDNEKRRTEARAKATPIGESAAAPAAVAAPAAAVDSPLAAFPNVSDARA